MRCFGLISSFCALLIALCSCENTTFQSSVPAYPVRVNIDTKMGEFVHFQPTSINSYVVVNNGGYFLNDKYVLPVHVTDAWGYGGVVVYVSMNGYAAFDLACPYCAGRGKKSPCLMDGIYAVCPTCGEKYELGSGYALPQTGICKETLRALRIIPSDGKLTVTQKQ